MKRLIIYICLLLCVALPVYGEPSYKQGFARNASESANPRLWKGLISVYAPILGVSGNTVFDWSGRKKNGTLIAGATWVATGGIDTSTTGVNIGTVPDITGDEFTSIIGTVPNAVAGGTETLIDLDGNNGQQFRTFHTSDTRMRFRLHHGGGATNLTPLLAAVAGVPMVITSLYDGVNMYLLKDNVIFDSTAATGAVDADGGVDKGLGVFGDFTTPYNGVIKYSYLWNRALTIKERTQLFIDPLALFRRKPPASYRVPDATTRRIMLITEYINKLKEQCLSGG